MPQSKSTFHGSRVFVFVVMLRVFALGMALDVDAVPTPGVPPQTPTTSAPRGGSNAPVTPAQRGGGQRGPLRGGASPFHRNMDPFPASEPSMNFAAFTDTHVGQRARSATWDYADNLDKLGDDIMDNTLPCEFVIHLGDGALNNTAFVNGIGLPDNLKGNYKNNLKDFLINHLKLPLHYVGGNIDLTDYSNEPGVKGHENDPFVLMKTYINETELNTYPYAFMRNGILFLALPEMDFEPWTRASTYEWIEFMTTHYHDSTTILLSHQAIEDTTPADGAQDSYRGQQDDSWWANLFQRNPQIKMFIHGHNHMPAWYQGNQSSGFSHPVRNFGHEMVFASPFPQMGWMVDYNSNDMIAIFTITAKGVTTKAWKNQGNAGGGGKWSGGYDMTWITPTTFDASAEDWYSFPVLIQDGETQTTDMKVLASKISLQLVGTGPVELFYDPHMETKGIHVNENILGFDDDPTNKVTANTPGMTVHGPHTMTFPPKHEWDRYCHDGHGGPPYHAFAVGTTPAAAPGGSYTVTMTAKSRSGNGKVTLSLSCSDWRTKSQFSTLAGSSKEVFAHNFKSEYETVTGTYTAPNDENAWFVQGSLNFADQTDVDVSYFSIKRTQTSDTTDDFRMTLSGKSYAAPGKLGRFQTKDFPVNPVDLADSEGIITFKPSISGNHYGIANVIYHGPVLMSRNARYKVNGVNGNTFDITLAAKISGFSNTFEMFPFSTKYGGVEIKTEGEAGTKQVSKNKNQWITYDMPKALAQEKILITYPAQSK